MGQSQAYKRRHPGRRGQISAQEYTELTFRWIAAARAEGEDSRGPGSREQGQSGQTRPHSSQGKDRQHRHSEAGQARGAEHRDRREAGRHSRPGTHTTHSRQSHTARRASEAAEGRGRLGARQQGAQVPGPPS